MTDIIPLPDDYDVPLNFAFLRRSPLELLHVLDGDIVYKLIYADNGKILVRITPEQNVFKVEYPDVQPNASQRALISSFIREWFDLDNDLTPFYALTAKDKLLKDVVAKYRGYRIVGQPDLFESLCWAVIGQQINVPFAFKLKSRFVEQFGDSITWRGQKFYAFPEPRVVANLNDSDLLPLQFSIQKSRYVRAIAAAFRDGVISKERISLLPFDDAKKKLMEIKGVGNWTANYALMKTFRYKEAFPLEDVGIHNAIKKLKGLAEKPTLDQVKAIFKKYKGWEAYATLYLWKTL